MPVSTLTVKYQATIPKVVRETLALAAGDRVEFLVEPSGEVRLRKALPDLAELRDIEATLAPEWDSPDDEAAYAGL
ncbi:MAG: type II toxin-antitoxin system PrlF family antitoxin [Gemmatimonadaceae bacterium]|nr:type II toxin-antitoxin system PrlF family antitoxin [Gemmatimonadaceae bacterium]MCW5826014.1 type II toxin-antitoxin system PrlF family antitoxin [Gemmatimonadaceae bacterium]